MPQWLDRVWKDESGQDVTEYALLVVLIALAIAVALTVLATGTNSAFKNYSNASGS